ncbi:MAG: hypothetical protein L6V91_04360 [Bacilli bacterium]|nr:MAG: hypothetical protein L6V91_04360 [Bacilli bacterium]
MNIYLLISEETATEKHLSSALVIKSYSFLVGLVFQISDYSNFFLVQIDRQQYNHSYYLFTISVNALL